MPEMPKDLANSKDMLVKLYALPAIDKLLMTLKNQNIVIRKAYAQEKLIVTNWVKENFNQAWANECEIAFNMQPIVCFIAINAEKIIGFATYNTTSLGVAGPIGIDKNFRKNSIAKALSIYGMNNMKHCGYQYAILGWINQRNQRYFNKILNAEIIENSMPMNGMYDSLLTELE